MLRRQSKTTGYVNPQEEEIGTGIWLGGEPASAPLIRNNTICNNYTYGIEGSEQGVQPQIVNCIIYGNDADDLYEQGGFLFENVDYCCLQNNHSGTDNITGDPGFMNPDDSNDLHIAETSPCKDAGDPAGSYPGESDIDGEKRIHYGRVDIGADEYYYSPADFDSDETVNFVDYAFFSAHWQDTEPGFSLDIDSDVDFDDLALFCEDWLWQPGWSQPFTCGTAGMDGLGRGLAFVDSQPARLAVVKAEPVDIGRLLGWLEDIRLDPEAAESLDRDKWAKLLKLIEELCRPDSVK